MYRTLKHFSLSLFLFCNFEFNLAQLSTCSGTGCPTNGVWGAWETIGDKACDMECGGCGTLFQTRDCISAPVCNCTGPSNRNIGCNNVACKYPTQKTCCPPFVPMVLNGTQVCGPLPKNIENSACCPQTALMSQWTGWQLQNSQWARTRDCLTVSIGCPCTGQTLTQTQATCPCAQPSNATSACSNLAIATPIYYRQLIINDATGSADLVLIAQNQGAGKIYCKALTDAYGSALGYEGAMLMMQEVSGQCTTDTVFGCAKGTDNARQNATFTCDGSTGNWIYDFTGKQIVGIVQGSWN